MATANDGTERGPLRVEGERPLSVPAQAPDSVELPVVRDSRGFECASGEWVEREWTGIPVFELLEAAGMPGETTHVQFESVDGYRACVPLLDLTDGLVAIGDGDGLPRLVAPHVVGPRSIKNLSRIRPLSVPPAEEREQYETLPIDDK